MKKILIVTHQFLPHQSPRTTRWKLIYDQLILDGFEVAVLTGTKQLENNPNIQFVGNSRASNVVKNLRNQSNTIQKSVFKHLIYKLLKKLSLI